MACTPSGAAEVVAAGTRPRWATYSMRLAYLNKQVHVVDLKSGGSRVVTDSPSPVTSYCWTPDGRGIAYLAVDARPEPAPIVPDHDYRYSRLYLQSLNSHEPRRLSTPHHPV